MLMITNSFKFLKEKEEKNSRKQGSGRAHSSKVYYSISVIFYAAVFFQLFLPLSSSLQRKLAEKVACRIREGYFYQPTTRLKILYLKCSRGLA